MIIQPDPNLYQCICDMCGKRSKVHATMSALLLELNLGSTLWDERPGWSIGQPPENITADEACIMSYKYSQHGQDPTKHLCQSCRAISNHYRD
jgi:hypothetical protein